MEQSIFRYLNNLKEHDHLCHLCYNHSECYEIAANFLAQGIKNTRTCVYISDRHAPAELTSRLEGQGVFHSENGKENAFEEILIQSPMKETKIASTIITNLKSSLDKILKKGHKPLRVLMAHSDLFYFLSQPERLWKKAILNKLCMEKPIILMNQYHVERISSHDLISIMKTHPTIVENNLVYKSPMYIKPDMIIKDFKSEYDNFKALSGKERRVLVLITNGLSNSGIAGELSISVKTVETHRANIMKKLDIHNLVDLVKFSMRNGMA